MPVLHRVPAWLLYRSFPGKCKMLSLHDFKADVTEGLCKQGKDESSNMKRGRPSTSAMTVKRRMPGLTPQPSSDVRYDGVGHWPEWRQVRAMCRYDGCKCVSRVICCKCRVSLCHNPKKDCFFEYHHGQCAHVSNVTDAYVANFCYFLLHFSSAELILVHCCLSGCRQTFSYFSLILHTGSVCHYAKTVVQILEILI